MSDIPISHALILWNSGLNGGVPAFAIRPLGHGDYDHYDYQVGACFTDWRKWNTDRQKAQLMLDVWHVVAFYDVPIEMIRDAPLIIPEYRDMLAEDCLPIRFQGERG